MTSKANPSENFTVRNHYVPQWYQRRFFIPGTGQSKLWYLDLKPEAIVRPNGSKTTRRALRQLGPVNCFKEDHLYTLYFGKYATDVIEKRFFGAMDSLGEKAVDFFADYCMRDGVHEAFNGMRNYLAAQFFRTPKGLDLLRTLSRSPSHQRALLVMQHAWQLYHTIWSEGVWEVVHCASSPTKFIVSDAPVTTYNKKVFPGSDEVRQLGGARLERVGTHTIFPIDCDHCLVITNMQYVRNPRINPLKIRENPQYFENRMFDLRKVQRGREISEDDVVAVNHILKTHARRYIAASNEDWLYPERHLKEKFWPKLSSPYFLHPDPRKVSFSTGILMGFKDGGAFGHNEYGHYDLDGPRAKALREEEWKTFQATKQAWDERDRLAGRPPYTPTMDDL
jgi:hypothetical protein